MIIKRNNDNKIRKIFSSLIFLNIGEGDFVAWQGRPKYMCLACQRAYFVFFANSFIFVCKFFVSGSRDRLIIYSPKIINRCSNSFFICSLIRFVCLIFKNALTAANFYSFFCNFVEAASVLLFVCFMFNKTSHIYSMYEFHISITHSTIIIKKISISVYRSLKIDYFSEVNHLVSKLSDFI